MRQFLSVVTLPLLLSFGAVSWAGDSSENYSFLGGYPSETTVQRVRDELDLNRAVQAYRFFFPAVSMYSGWKGSVEQLGMKPNQSFALLEASPRKQVLTANSDTPYATMLLDLSQGPMVVELPPGPLMALVNDLNQQWVMDLGLTGPDKGLGGRHLVLPPGEASSSREGFFVGKSSTNRALLILRALPKGGDTQGAVKLMGQVRVHPLNATRDIALQWIDQSGMTLDSLLLQSELTLGFWQLLHELVEAEPASPDQLGYYGDLAALGIAKGRPFEPDERMRGILLRAARMANAQLRVESFADDSPDRLVWPGRQWEWAVLRPEQGSFVKAGHLDQVARDKWFFQALGDSPAMFRRVPGAGSLYWLNTRDNQGRYLDGARTYRLRVPPGVPARLFWSITLYDAQTRSQIRNHGMQSALRSLNELREAERNKPLDLYFGPKPPAGREGHWIETRPGEGWFAYFRIYGPEQAAFDGSWKLDDFEEIR
ncbi:DUF1254 domain-containing protein [Pseudomonas sp. Pseusp97]|uniref:DUF1254 domain-containing protein n=1 Tax=Pseudomonas sp. Pseusp97 TaxID=3243065 RepID=UPI0039A4F2C7